MPQRREKGDSENHDRWLISYSDFITLLLALFVVLYAISQVNEGKYQIVAGSLGSAFGNPSRALVTLDIPGPIPVNSGADPAPDYLAVKKARRLAEAQRRRQEKMRSIEQQVVAAFDPVLNDANRGQVSISRSSIGVRVEIDASLLFSPGQAELNEDSGRVLEAMAQVLKDVDHAIQVEGHTDNVPISTERFPTNWELSAIRASTVVRLLIANGIDATRLTAASFGETRPLESNENEEGRRRNRRVTVLILPVEPENPVASGADGSTHGGFETESGKKDDASAEAGATASI